MTNFDQCDGIRGDLSNADYHAGPGLSKSDLDKLAVSVAYYAWAKEHPDPPTEAMQIGTAFHAAILGPDKYTAEVAVVPEGIDRRTKAGREAWAEWVAANKGKAIISAESAAMIEKMRGSVMGNPIAAAMVEGSAHEESAFVTVDGILRKCRPDGYSRENNVIIDLKSTGDASMTGFRRAVSLGRYHVQQAWYSDIIERITGEQPSFYFIACEKRPPYPCAIYELDFETVAKGHELMMRDLARYARAKESGDWSEAYPKTIQPLRLSNWELGQDVLM